MTAGEAMSQSVPILQGWYWSGTDKIQGRVHGRPGFDDGELIETSKVLHIQEGFCCTENGRCYRLGQELEGALSSAATRPPSTEPPPSKTPPSPIIEQWEWCEQCNGVSGNVYGKAGFEDGTWIRTSEVPAHQRFSSHVVTKNGTTYRLGERKFCDEQQQAAEAAQQAAEAEAAEAARAERKKEAAEAQRRARRERREEKLREQRVAQEAEAAEAARKEEEVEAQRRVWREHQREEGVVPELLEASGRRGWKTCKPAPMHADTAQLRDENAPQQTMATLGTAMQQFRLL